MSILRDLINGTGSIIKYAFKDVEKSRHYTGLTDKELESMIYRRSVSDLLFHRIYQPISKDFGLYAMDDESVGFILQIYPPPYLGTDIEDMVSNFYAMNFPVGTSVQFSTFASRNLNFVMSRYTELHPCKLNIKNPHMLKKIIASRRRFISGGIGKSLFKSHDFRVRNFINLVAVKFPRGTDIEVIQNIFSNTLSRFSKMGARNFGASEFIPYVQEILNPAWTSWDVFNSKGKTLNKLCVGADTHIKLDTPRKSFYLSARSEKPWAAKTVTIKEPSEYLNAFDFQRMFFDQLQQECNILSSPFFMQLTVVIDDRYKLKEMIQDKVNNNIENLSKVGKYALSNPVLKDRFDEARDVAVALKDGEFPLPAMWSLTVFDERPSRLNQIVDSILSRFDRKNFKLQVEDHATIAFQSMIFSLPLQYNKITAEHLKRFDLLFKTNGAQVCPILSDFRGRGDIVTPIFGRTAQIQAIDLFSNKAGNSVVVGGTGTGKSFFVSDLITHSLAAGCKVVMADLGYNYANLNSLIGGQMIDFEPNKNLCMNFFTKCVCMTNEETGEFILDASGRKQIDKEELLSITQIIGMMMGLNLNAGQGQDNEQEAFKKYMSSVIQDCVQVAFEAEQHNANMSDVAYNLERYIKIISQEQPQNAETLSRYLKALKPYADKSGPYYGYFNGSNNINFESDSLILELNRLKGNDDLFYVAYMAVMNFVAAEFFLDRSRRKLFIQEEAWAVLPIEIIVSFLEDLFRRIRKYNGAVVIVTNSIQDFGQSLATKSMFENAPWKFFTEVDSSALKKAVDEKTIYLNDLEEQVIESVKRTNEYSELFIKTGAEFSVARVAVDPYSKYLFANATNETKEIIDISAKYGLEKQDAIYFVALKEERNLPDETILQIIESEKRAA